MHRSLVSGAACVAVLATLGAGSALAAPAAHHKHPKPHQPTTTAVSLKDPRNDVVNGGSAARYFRSSVNITKFVMAHHKRQLGVGVIYDDLKPLTDGSTTYTHTLLVQVRAPHLKPESIYVSRSGLKSHDVAGVLPSGKNAAVRCMKSITVDYSVKTSSELVVLPLSCLQLNVPLRTVRFTALTDGRQVNADGAPISASQVAGHDQTKALTGLK